MVIKLRAITECELYIYVKLFEKDIVPNQSLHLYIIIETAL
jgi:hypothetical protein